MGSHITKHEVEKIISLIDQWNDNDKFTWESLCQLANKRLAIVATRQTLYSQKKIKTAYHFKKEKLRTEGVGKVKVPPSLNLAAHRIAKLEAENMRLIAERNALLAQFVVWQYNAMNKELTIEDLNKPIPRIKQKVSI